MNDENFINIISTFIEQQLPEFVRQNYPLFVEYLKTYYQFMEQKGGAVERIQSFQKLIDIDTTEDDFFPLFKSAFLASLPETFLADRAIVVKHIKDFYASKSTETAMRLLFRIVYGEDIEIFLPKTKILRASDGKWQRNISVFITDVVGDVFKFEQGNLIGSVSGAKAVVDLVEEKNLGSFNYYQLFLLDFDGTFEENETVFSEQFLDIQARILGIVRDIEITNPGDDYAVGDPIIINHPNGVGATAMVSKVDATNPVVSFVINNGGNNHRVGDSIDFSRNGGNGVGAIAKVSAINVTSSTTVVTTTIGEHQNVVLSDVASIAIIDYVNTETIELGEITAIDVLDGGKFYPSEIFEVDVLSDAPRYGLPQGIGAEVGAVTANTGKILEAKILTHGFNYDDTATADFTSSGNGLATGIVKVDGGALVDGGFYRNTDGHLSSDKVLQDNVYYQNYSYVIKSKQSINDYRDIVKTSTHTTGTALFGEINIVEVLSNQMSVNPLPLVQTIVNNTQNPTNVVFLRDAVDVLYWEGYIPCPEQTVSPKLIGDYATFEIGIYANWTIEEFLKQGTDLCYRQNQANIALK